VAFAAYAYLLVNEPSIRIVSYALVNPGIAVFLGFLFGNETAAPYMPIGFPLILLGLTTMLYGETLLGRLRQRREKRSGVR
jgi:drug/metabolite transporter (DMT)-like permease